MIEGSWISFAITGTGKTSGVCDLGKVFETAVILLPSITSGTITVQGAKTSGGTYADLYTYNHATGYVKKMTVSPATTGGYFCVFPIGGFQFIKLESSVDQTDETFYAMGVRS